MLQKTTLWLSIKYDDWRSRLAALAVTLGDCWLDNSAEVNYHKWICIIYHWRPASSSIFDLSFLLPDPGCCSFLYAVVAALFVWSLMNGFEKGAGLLFGEFLHHQNNRSQTAGVQHKHHANRAFPWMSPLAVFSVWPWFPEQANHGRLSERGHFPGVEGFARDGLLFCIAIPRRALASGKILALREMKNERWKYNNVVHVALELLPSYTLSLTQYNTTRRGAWGLSWLS